MNNQIINELRTSPLAMVQAGTAEMEAVLHEAQRPASGYPELQALQRAQNDSDICNVFNNSGYYAERIAIISITGMMMKYTHFNWSMEDLELIAPGMPYAHILLSRRKSYAALYDASLPYAP